MIHPTVLRLAFLALAIWPATAQAGCHDYRQWRFGGRPFGADVTDLCDRVVGAQAKEGQINYTLGTDTHVTCTIVAKDRPARPGERLPFGVAPTDSPQQAFAKLQARGASPSYEVSGRDPTPVAVSPACHGDKPGDYDFEFDFDHDGKMTGVREALLIPYHEGPEFDVR
jgi:hypothetical protein